MNQIHKRNIVILVVVGFAAATGCGGSAPPPAAAAASEPSGDMKDMKKDDMKGDEAMPASSAAPPEKPMQ